MADEPPREVVQRRHPLYRFEIEGMNFAVGVGHRGAAIRIPAVQAEPAPSTPKRRRIKEEIISDSEDGPMETLTEYDFLDPSTTHDRVLIIEDTRVYVESRYLSVWSEFFENLFTNSSFREASQEEINVSLLTKDEMILFLRVIYPGTYDIKPRNFAKLMSLGYRLISKGLVARCRKYYQENFRQLDKATLLKLSFEHGITDLKKKILLDMKRSHHTNEINADDPKTIKNDWIPLLKENIADFTPEMAHFVLKGLVQ